MNVIKIDSGIKSCLAQIDQALGKPDGWVTAEQLWKKLAKSLPPVTDEVSRETNRRYQALGFTIYCAADQEQLAVQHLKNAADLERWESLDRFRGYEILFSYSAFVAENEFFAAHALENLARMFPRVARTKQRQTVLIFNEFLASVSKIENPSPVSKSIVKLLFNFPEIPLNQME